MTRVLDGKATTWHGWALPQPSHGLKNLLAPHGPQRFKQMPVAPRIPTRTKLAVITASKGHCRLAPPVAMGAPASWAFPLRMPPASATVHSLLPHLPFGSQSPEPNPQDFPLASPQARMAGNWPETLATRYRIWVQDPP